MVGFLCGGWIGRGVGVGFFLGGVLGDVYNTSLSAHWEALDQEHP